MLGFDWQPNLEGSRIPSLALKDGQGWTELRRSVRQF